MMQRAFLLISAWLALYVSGLAHATEPVPLPPPPAAEQPAPHIALLLPLKSETFGPSAQIVEQGFKAAAGVLLTEATPGNLPVRVYGSFDESKDAVALYRLAVSNGAQAVVGPLTRSGVAALAAEKNLPVPTLVLNGNDTGGTQGKLYFFGLSIENEAKQVARLINQDGLHQLIVISTRSQLSHRLQLAVEEEWVAQGNKVVREIEFNDDPAVFADVAAQPDTAIFLAADAVTARYIRPFLPNRAALYASSQIFAGNSDAMLNYDLSGIHFVDMPWLLQPEHPATMTYPRITPALSNDQERLYALGVDAYRLIRVLLENKTTQALPLDGVSGTIKLEGRQFVRSALPAVFVQGRAQPADAPVAATPIFFPAQLHAAASAVPAQ
ncbi:MAG: penicillin-binding protein activator [Gallionella sp.]|nr:penicillin-binding protein activator [Gallionella sp.]